MKRFIQKCGYCNDGDLIVHSWGESVCKHCGAKLKVLR